MQLFVEISDKGLYLYRKLNAMKTIKLNDLLKDQVRQIEKEINWALQLNNHAKAQELIFEMIKINKQIN